MSDSDVEYEAETFEIGSCSLKITTIAFLPIEKLMSNREKETEISGQKLWCGSLGVLQYLMNHPEIIIGNTVVELGSGTGVLGIMCKKIGAKQVYLTDHDVVSIKHMENDCLANHVECNIRRLDWFSPTLENWEINVDNDGSIVIVAGDVLYKNSLVVPFFETVKIILSLHINSRMFLCHIPRAGVEHIQVVSCAANNCLVVDEIGQELWKTGDCFKYCDSDDLARAKLYQIRQL